MRASLGARGEVPESGRSGLTRNQVNGLRHSVGSNPTLSATSMT